MPGQGSRLAHQTLLGGKDHNRLRGGEGSSEFAGYAVIGRRGRDLNGLRATGKMASKRQQAKWPCDLDGQRAHGLEASTGEVAM